MPEDQVIRDLSAKEIESLLRAMRKEVNSKRVQSAQGRTWANGLEAGIEMIQEKMKSSPTRYTV